MNRAYALLEWRAVDEEQRIVEGIASTSAVDDYGTVLEPKGARFALPMPLLWQHRSDEPVGTVLTAKVTNGKITVRAQLARIAEPGPMKDLVDKAWQAVKHGLVRGFSVGFKPEKTAGGTSATDPIRFIEWAWRELSLVTLPANTEATIQAVRSADMALRAASGARQPGDSGAPTRIPNRPMTRTERLARFEQSRAAKQARMVELVDAAAGDNGRSFTEEEEQEYADLENEVRALDTQIQRAGIEVQAAVRTAVAVETRASTPGTQDRAPAPRVEVRERERTGGINMARLVRAQLVSRKEMRPVSEIVQRLYPDDSLMQRAAVAAHNTTTDSALVSDEGGIYADFVEYLRPRTIIGQFGLNGIPELRSVPFRVPLITQTGAGAGYWVGEGAAKPVTKFTWSRTTLEPTKVADIAVITDELLRVATPSADSMIRRELVNALRARMDTDFIDPDKAASAGISPASITNGVTPVASSGTDAAAVRADIAALFAAFIADNNTPQDGVWIMPSTMALALSLMTNALGQQEFNGIGMNGGTLFGLPVIVSEYVPTAYDPDDAGAAVAGSIVVLANASDIYLADEGGFAVDASREASLQMDDAPTNNSVTPTATTLVSMFQTNSTAIRAERTVNWARRRDSSVQFLSSVAWAA